MSMQAFADRIGVSKSTVSLWESGSRNVPPQMVKAISKEYGVNEDWLLTGSGEPFIKLTDNEKISAWVARVLEGRDESTQKRFLKLITQLNDSDWQAIGALLAKGSMLLNEQNNE